MSCSWEYCFIKNSKTDVLYIKLLNFSLKFYTIIGTNLNNITVNSSKCKYYNILKLNNNY